MASHWRVVSIPLGLLVCKGITIQMPFRHDFTGQMKASELERLQLLSTNISSIILLWLTPDKSARQRMTSGRDSS